MSISPDEPAIKRRPPPADPATVIWRYMDVYSLLTLMNDQCLAFHQFRDLRGNDEREGMVPEGFTEDIITSNSEDNRERLLCFTYANCWNMNDCENILMWKAYAPQGIAVRTTVGKFAGARMTKVMDTEVKVGNVPRIEQLTIEYADDWAQLEKEGYQHDGIPLNVLFVHLKRRAFRGEAEVRFRVSPDAFPPQPDGSFVSPDPADCKLWCPVTFETLGWIDEVVTAPSVQGWAAEPISRLVKGKGLNFRRSGLSR